MVRSIGADRVVDYSKGEFTSAGERYDLILDCIANHSLSAFRRVMNPQGAYVLVGAADGGGKWVIDMLVRLFKALVLSRFGSQKWVMVGAKVLGDDLAVLGELIKTGKLAPVIERRYSLREVPEALRYIETGHARGKVVITL
jgi:NADPH:quinone reductase-like Zn-dependent oxidoreductase